MQRPKSIIWFSRLFLVFIAVAILKHFALVLSFGATNLHLMGNPQVLSGKLLTLIMTIVWLFDLMMWYLITRCASKIARSIWVFICVVGPLRPIFRLIISLTHGSFPSFYECIEYVFLIVNVVGVWFLFRPDARAWFRGESTDLKDVFG